MSLIKIHALLVLVIFTPLVDALSGKYEVNKNREQVLLTEPTKPWDKHFCYVGTNHKAGSQLLRNIMSRSFDALGANYSCRFGPHSSITKVGGENPCLSTPDCHIKWDNDIEPKKMSFVRANAREANMPLHGVHIIRDPFFMIASAYCYHHRGMEVGSPWAPKGITEMDYAEGIPAIAQTMFPIIDHMVKAYIANQGDMYTVRFENLTKSSEDFDTNVALIFDFMFGDHISLAQRQQIETEAMKEDLHRGLNGRSKPNHHSSDNDEAMALAHISHLPANLYGIYRQYRDWLGYS